MRESTFGSGLPPAPDNESKWDYMRPLLADPALKPDAGAIQTAHARARELLRIRFSSPLFRLGSARLVQDRVSFPNGGPGQTPGVIAMAIDDRAGRDLDRRLEGVVVVFNASPEPVAERVAAASPAGATALHPVQARGGDPIVRGSALRRRVRDVHRAGPDGGGVRRAALTARPRRPPAAPSGAA